MPEKSENSIQFIVFVTAIHHNSILNWSGIFNIRHVTQELNNNFNLQIKKTFSAQFIVKHSVL